MVQREARAHPLGERVLQPGARAEGGGEPGGVQRIVPRVPVGRVVDDPRQAFAQPPDRVFRERIEDRVGVRPVEGLDRVRHRVHAARCGDLCRQSHRQTRIVDDRPRQRRVRCALYPVERVADVPVVLHFGTRIGRHQGDHRLLRFRRPDLGKADGRSAAQRDEPFGAGARDVGLQKIVCLLRHAFGRDRRDGGAVAADEIGKFLRDGCAAGGTKDQSALDRQTVELVAQRFRRAFAENRAGQAFVVNERFHRRSLAQFLRVGRRRPTAIQNQIDRSGSGILTLRYQSN